LKIENVKLKRGKGEVENLEKEVKSPGATQIN